MKEVECLLLWNRLKFRCRGWTLNLVVGSKEGYCWESRKRLDIGLANCNPLRLLLHEVAHIGSFSQGNRHNQKWCDIYKMLLKKYLPGIRIGNGLANKN